MDEKEFYVLRKSHLKTAKAAHKKLDQWEKHQDKLDKIASKVEKLQEKADKSLEAARALQEKSIKMLSEMSYVHREMARKSLANQAKFDGHG